MRFYFVDPPPYEDAGEGEDHREWFTALADARKCFNDYVHRIRVHEIEGDKEGWDGVHRDNFASTYCALGYIEVDANKAGILRLLNSRAMCGYVKLDEYA